MDFQFWLCCYLVCDFLLLSFSFVFFELYSKGGLKMKGRKTKEGLILIIDLVTNWELGDEMV